jgi:hypothetical protein
MLKSPKLIIAELERRRGESDQQDFIETELAKLGKRLLTLDREQGQLLQWTLKGFPEDTVTKENNKMNRERVDLKRRKAELEKSIRDIRDAEIDLEKVETYCHLARENLAMFTHKEKRLILEELNIKVWLSGKSVAIEGVIPVAEVNTMSTQL